VYLMVDLGFYPPLTFYEASRFVPPIGWTPMTDRTDKDKNERTDGRTTGRLSSSVCPSIS